MTALGKGGLGGTMDGQQASTWRTRPARRSGIAAALLLCILSLATPMLRLVPGVSWQQQAARAVSVMPAPPLPPGFRFNKVVAIIAFDRFEYFRQVIDALQQAWGAEQYTVTIWVDGPPRNASTYDSEGFRSIVTYSQQLQWLARNGGLGFRDVLVNVSATNLGVWANKKRGVAGAMELSDFAVILEDDIMAAQDALRWFEWHVTSGLIFRQPNIAVATCWSTSFPYNHGAVEAHDWLMVQQLGLLDKFWLDQWAQPWGWALWRRTWDAVGEEWTGRDFHLGRLVSRRGWFETMPLVARCNNIGNVGVHKKGATKGHVHMRSLTSASFPNLEHCRYSQLPRGNYSSRVFFEPMYNDLVRRGLVEDSRFVDMPLEKHLSLAETFLRNQDRASQWKSSC